MVSCITEHTDPWLLENRAVLFVFHSFAVYRTDGLDYRSILLSLLELDWSFGFYCALVTVSPRSESGGLVFVGLCCGSSSFSAGGQRHPIIIKNI